MIKNIKHINISIHVYLMSRSERHLIARTCTMGIIYKIKNKKRYSSSTVKTIRTMSLHWINVQYSQCLYGTLKTFKINTLHCLVMLVIPLQLYGRKLFSMFLKVVRIFSVIYNYRRQTQQFQNNTFYCHIRAIIQF